MMPLGERKKIILRAIVDDYIKTADPVGSKALAGRGGLKLSPATLRNEMAELEHMGYLEQPHTSAGRVPSAQGYRMYVDTLMKRHRLSPVETETINRALQLKMQELDRLISDAGRLVSDLTHYTSYAMLRRSAEDRIRHIDILCIGPDSCVVVLVLESQLVKNALQKKTAETDEAMLKAVASALNRHLVDVAPAEVQVELCA
ncbi:heat-inducible transcriptional repressor HrcA, partial [Oscillospiraceae bacterium OttesenSCG-928-F05]|nr:heat-inducible transcriptional repressor HrcA [Oscillospiraceae bacterium OttesenSCG-928-F05]